MNSSPSLSAPRTKPLTVRGQRTRQQLLDAAEAVFGEVGYDQASIAEVTRRAGVALGTFYVYFPHKQAIFVELIDELGSRLRGALAEGINGLTDRLELERAGFEAFLDFARLHRNLYRVVRQAEFVDLDAYHRYYRRIAEAYTHGLSKAMDANQISRFDPEVAAYALMGIADFVGMRFVLWETPADRQRVVNEVMALISHGLLNPERRGLPKPSPTLVVAKEP